MTGAAMERAISPITGKANTEFIARYNPSVTSDTRVVDGPVDNWLCLDTGLVFNSTGTRGQEIAFYEHQYDLHKYDLKSGRRTLSQLMYFDQGVAKSVYDNIVEFVHQGAALPATGRALDVGCGNGLLLSSFDRSRPGWQLHGVEPSRNAAAFFAEVMPQFKVFEGGFHQSPFVKETFDMVFAEGVLEHVRDPMLFLSAFRNCLREDGVGFIGIPNFETNPTDLLTFDHLSRFTADVIRGLFRPTGLEIVHEWVLSSRVPMWFLVRCSQPAKTCASWSMTDVRRLCWESMAMIDGMFRSYNRAASVSARDGGRVAIYGTGIVGFLGLRITDLTNNKVCAFIDDNSALWGTQRAGIPVHSPADIRLLDVRHIVLSANSCYHAALVKRIRDAEISPITIYLPGGDGERDIHS